ncbi:MAG: nucleotidyl transferase AbiEii/AbiGii toxin family protein [Deltaproteobacteria bacterium]|nr:nucleotidyl transferase AbiEii/AbiGii toxin family protein [Deltaproteobacteria bacterium]
MNDMSKSKLNKLLAEMLQACKEYIASDFLTALNERITRLLPDRQAWKLTVDPEDGHVVNFSYPVTTQKVDYLQHAVRLELGTHADFIPNDRYSIRPYAADHFPDIFEGADCPVQAINVERTFWRQERDRG